MKECFGSFWRFLRTVASFQEYHIHLQLYVKPIVTAPCRVPSALEETVKAELERMEDYRVTEPTN